MFGDIDLYKAHNRSYFGSFKHSNNNKRHQEIDFFLSENDIVQGNCPHPVLPQPFKLNLKTILKTI